MATTFARGPFSISVVAETGNRFADFAPYVAAVNDDGLVSFQATLTDGGSGVYESSPDGVRAVAESSRGAFTRACSHPALNRRGTTCFYAEIEDEESALFVERDSTLVAVARGVGPLGPTMNDEGRIAFRGVDADGYDGVFAVDEAGVTVIADTSTELTGFEGLPVIDGQGVVTFRVDSAPGLQCIYRSDGASTSLVVETGGEFARLGFFPFATDTGVVACCATRADGTDGVFTWHEGEPSTVIDTSGAFESFRGVLLDDTGSVVFYGTPRGRELGIFVGPDPDADCLFAIGTPLLGSRVVDFALNPVSINRAGQLAVRVRLDDGRGLVLRADPD